MCCCCRLGGKHAVVQHLELTCSFWYVEPNKGRKHFQWLLQTVESLPACQRGEKSVTVVCVSLRGLERVLLDVRGQRKSVTVVSVDVRGERRSVTVVCVSLCGLERVWFCGCICEREKRIILVKDCLGVFIY